MTEGLVSHVLFALLLITAVMLTIKTGKLSTSAAITGGIVAVLLYAGTGYSGIALLATFFVIGVASTSWKKEFKHQLHTEAGNTTRNAGQVLANGGVAAFLSVAAIFFPDFLIPLVLMIACSLSSATADTSSSELGILYGKGFYNILTLKKDIPGENGVVSLEGTLIGIAGSIIVALVYGLVVEFRLSHMAVIVIAGTAGNIVDSLAGAWLERKELLSNNAVNLLNTFIAAAVGGVLYYLVSR